MTPRGRGREVRCRERFANRPYTAHHNIDAISRQDCEAAKHQRRRGGRNFGMLSCGIPLGATTMRQMRMLVGTIGLLAVGMSASVATARDQGACGQIRATCMAAGFAPGAAREGIGLQVHCMMPIMQARAQPPTARRPLPKVDPQLVADCRAGNLRFGPPMMPPAEIAEPAPARPAPPASAPPPGQDIVLRPPRSITAEQRAMISALPPEDQPETGPAKA